jgi:hypothetical protein
MGKLVLQHLQRASPYVDSDVDASAEDSGSSDEDMQTPIIKNTFIHFKLPSVNNPRRAVLRRHRTDPAPQVSRGAFRLVACEDAVSGSHAAKGDALPSNDATVESMPPIDEAACAAATGEDVPKTDDEGSTETPVSLSEEPANQGANTSWLVDGRRLKGRDTRISSPLRPTVGKDQAILDIVMTIFPLCKSTKRGGACFKAAEGVGHIQLKCNNPIDKELSVCITVGGHETRCQKHNFNDNALMQFIGDWNFLNFINSRADRPTVAVSLQLLPTDEEVTPSSVGKACMAGATIVPAIADPAIAAFSLSSTKYYTSCHPQQLEMKTKKAKVVFGDFCDNEDDPVAKYECSTTPSSTPDLSPQATPRSPQTPQMLLSPMPNPNQLASPTPLPPPCFTYNGSLLFSFTIRLADCVQLGLDVNRDEENQELVVQRVIPGCAAEAWNRQCFAGPFSSKAIVPTDRIVGINGRCDNVGMLDECRHNKLLRLFVVRGDLPHADIPLKWYGMAIANPIPTVQIIAVPVHVPVIVTPCGKHGMMISDGGLMAAGAEHAGGTSFCTDLTGTLRASASEFVPAETGQVTESNMTESIMHQ